MVAPALLSFARNGVMVRLLFPLILEEGVEVSPDSRLHALGDIGHYFTVVGCSESADRDHVLLGALFRKRVDTVVSGEVKLVGSPSGVNPFSLLFSNVALQPSNVHGFTSSGGNVRSSEVPQVTILIVGGGITQGDSLNPVNDGAAVGHQEEGLGYDNKSMHGSGKFPAKRVLERSR